MTRILPCCLLLVGLLLGGCSRSADPLDWKIEGRHLPDLQESLDHIIADLPAPLRREFLFCFNNVKADTLAYLSGTREDQENRLCRRLRDKTVRAILIEGNWLAYRASSSRLLNESNALLSLVEHGDEYPEAQRQMLASRIERSQARIAYLSQAVGKSDRRLTELWGSATPP